MALAIIEFQGQDSETRQGAISTMCTKKEQKDKKADPGVYNYLHST